MTHRKIRYSLTSITGMYRKLKFKAPEGHMLFCRWPMLSYYFLSLWKTGSNQGNLVQSGAPNLELANYIYTTVAGRAILFTCFIASSSETDNRSSTASTAKRKRTPWTNVGEKQKTTLKGSGTSQKWQETKMNEFANNVRCNAIVFHSP